jgi:hypothetical protein
MALIEAAEYRSYDDVPTYRKRWFFVLCILFFIPAGIVVAATGDVYTLSKGKVMKLPAGTKTMLIVAWSAILLMNIVRALAST